MAYNIISLEDIYESIGEEKLKEILNEFECDLNKDVEYFIKEKAIQFVKLGIAKTFLISLFELEPLAKFIEQPKTVTLGYMKEAIINDFDTMNSLIKLQSRNLEYENRKKTLWGPSSNEHITYIQLNKKEKNMALAARLGCDGVERRRRAAAG